MANKIKGFRKGMTVVGTLNSAGGEKVEGKITKVNCKGKAVVEVEGRGKCIIPLHSLKEKKSGSKKTKTRATAKKKTKAVKKGKPSEKK